MKRFVLLRPTFSYTSTAAAPIATGRTTNERPKTSIGRFSSIQAKPRRTTGGAPTWAAQSEYGRAIADYDEAIRLDPYYVSAYYERAVSFTARREYERAIADYSKCVRLDEEFEPGYRGRAWTWATCPVEKFRDGERAVESATKACELCNWRDVSSINVLAAAHAEARDFASAVKWQEQALGLTANEGEKEHLRRRLELYKAQRPYREPAGS